MPRVHWTIYLLAYDLQLTRQGCLQIILPLITRDRYKYVLFRQQGATRPNSCSQPFWLCTVRKCRISISMQIFK